MIPIDGRPILTASQMRTAEDRTIAAGTRVDTLMTRAGEGVAHAVRRMAAGADVLVICGTGNNGGDGYIAAATLRRMGHAVRVAAQHAPKTEAAARARALWDAQVAPLADAGTAPIVVDALLGTGLGRPLDPALDATLAQHLAAARFRVAVDLPSGVGADTASPPAYLHDRAFDLTLALGALKPAHLLQPATRACGAVRLIDLRIADLPDAIRVASTPDLPQPGPDAHKYTRGMVAIVAGGMAGAARLAAVAALRSGAGYAALYGGSDTGGPDALVHRPYDADALTDRRIGATVIGPGLGRDDRARQRVAAAIAADVHPLLIDGDALHLVAPDTLHARRHPVVLTPHAGEFTALFGDIPGNLIDQAREGARRARAIVVLKGPTTIVATADRAVVTQTGNPWLSTAGTGDVLAGTIAAQLAHPGTDAFAAAAAGVWLHARAARLAGRSFIADDLAIALTAARAGA